MPTTEIPKCECEDCQQEKEHPNRAPHQQINLLVSRLDEHQRLWYVALESNRIGHGSDVLMIPGLEQKTIRRGLRRWEQGLRIDR